MNRESRDFQARMLDWQEIHELPDVWTPDRLLSLLASLEVDDVAAEDALEMTLLALQDLESDEAADRVLEAVFGDAMRPGVRRGLAHDLGDERPWEEFADITRHAGIFSAVVLLQRAFPRDYDKPDAVSVAVSLATASERGKVWLDAPTPDPGLLVRILAAAMDEHAVLQRLFHDSLRGTSFPEAGGILWQVSRRDGAAQEREFTLISSHQWFDPLRNADHWTAQAWIDEPAP